MRTRPTTARGFRENKAVAVRSYGPAVGNLYRFIDKVVEVLERILQPLHLRQSGGHMHAHLKERNAQTNRKPKVSGKPADAHDVAYLRVDVQNIGRLRHQKRSHAG